MKQIEELYARADNAIARRESVALRAAEEYGKNIRSVARQHWFRVVVMEILTEEYDCWAPLANEVIELRKNYGL